MAEKGNVKGCKEKKCTESKYPRAAAAQTYNIYPHRVPVTRSSGKRRTLAPDTFSCPARFENNKANNHLKIKTLAY